MRLLLLLTFFGCSPTPSATVQSPPPTPSFFLDAPTSIQQGDTLSLTATLPIAAPSTPVRFVIGRGGIGPGPCFTPGCLDVVGPLIVLGQVSPTGGTASLDRVIPATAPDGLIAIQAAQVTPSGALLLSEPVEVLLGAECGDGILAPQESCYADALITGLANDFETSAREISRSVGWPAPVEGGLLFATDVAGDWQLAGDHSGWSGQAMNRTGGLSWRIEPIQDPGGYKFTDGTTWRHDPHATQYNYDSFGQISLIGSPGNHLERYPLPGSGDISARMMRIWVPEAPATHVVYAHDGQNLFDPAAIWGGWQLQSSVPAGMMVVGIDNTIRRMDEYTHVPDDIGGGLVGGLGDAYADYVETVVRPVIQGRYGEPDKRALLGSSLGGLISLHIADRYPDTYLMTASMSGTVGWGSLGLQEQTIIERYAAAGPRPTVVFLDSGGNGPCIDADGDGLQDDDPAARDNYCENAQFRDTLIGVGYTIGVDLHHWYEPNAPHNEAAWAARVWRPLNIFASL